MSRGPSRSLYRDMIRAEEAREASGAEEPPDGGPREGRPAEAYRVLLADDHPVVRRGLRALLASQPGVEICGEAANGAQAVALARERKPDLVLLDLSMPETNGLDALRALRAEELPPEIVVLTMHFSDELAREVLRAGALGYVLKSDADADLLAAVEGARRRKFHFTEPLAEAMARQFVAKAETDAPPPGEAAPAEEAAAAGETPEGQAAGTVPLSPRETQVVRLLVAGKSNREAGEELGVSPRTIESHRKHAMRKLGLHSFSDLVRYAVRARLSGA